MINIRQLDCWLIKGFDGIANLVIQRSQQGKIEEKELNNLKLAISQIKIALVTKQKDAEVDTDPLMFQLLLSLSTILLDRMGLDKSVDRANITAMRGYLTTIQKALERFEENELRKSGREGVEEDHQ